MFDTLGTAHGEAALSGEEALEALYLSLRQMRDALDSGDATARRSLLTGQSSNLPPGRRNTGDPGRMAAHVHPA